MNTSSIDNALIQALQGNAILFLGAGIGQECLNKLGETLPNGGKLASKIAKALEREGNVPELSRIAQFYRKRRGAYSLKNLLEENLSVESVSPRLNEFLKIPWRRIYTTNYDNLLEIARPKNDSFSHTQQASNVSKGSCIHINGSLSSATLQNLDTELVLTDWSYANSSFPDSKWANFLRQDINSCSALIFIGYSMRDLDITRVLIAGEDLKQKTVIVTSSDADDIDLEILGEYGVVYPTGFDFVAARRKQIAKTDYRSEDDHHIFTSLMKLEFSASFTYENDRVVRSLYDQFIFGKVDEGFISICEANFDPLIDREVISDIAISIDEGSTADAILIGGIGSGKTFSALSLARKFASRGYATYQTINRRNIIEDIECAVKNDRSLIIFDNCTRYLDEIEHFNSIRRPSHVAVYTLRSSLYDLFSHRLNSGPPVAPLMADLEKLTYRDLISLDKLLNFSGLWNEFAGWKTDRRVKFAQSTLSSSMSRILIRAAQSEDIIERIKSEIEPILEDKDLSLFFVSALILNILQYDFWISDWQNVFGTQSIVRGLERHKSALSHFVNVDASTIAPRAGLIATEILNSVVDSNSKIKALERVFSSAMENSSFDDEMRHLVVDLMKYSNVELFFEEGSDKLSSLKKYYHTIRPYGDTKNRSDYWLQLGIALSIHGNLQSDEDLRECELAFKNAYEREKSKYQPNLRRIDNYYSRFQLQMSVVERDPAKAFSLFWNGSMQLIRQIFDEETRHYPFKVGKLFTDIAAVHYNNWDLEMRSRFMQRCREMLAYAEERQKTSSHRDVQFLSGELQRLISKVESNGSDA